MVPVVLAGAALVLQGRMVREVHVRQQSWQKVEGDMKNRRKATAEKAVAVVRRYQVANVVALVSVTMRGPKEQSTKMAFFRDPLEPNGEELMMQQAIGWAEKQGPVALDIVPGIDDLVNAFCDCCGRLRDGEE